ncbi:Rpp14/Pop5 family protein [uncultured Methanobrevibacter sp.]|uniref:Rpp14/Pop5 family protein n=1 Tax=uncultured Methanobrevibacter sp. TaxID=253161 RepID=UPI002618ECA2
MKLKILPPTLRKNNHYLIVDVKSEVKLSKEELLNPIWDACIRFWGENHSSNFNLWVMKHYFIKEVHENNEDYFNYKAIVRCQRDYCEDLRSALITLTRYNKKRISMNTIGISGTIKGAVSKFIDEE